MRPPTLKRRFSMNWQPRSWRPATSRARSLAVALAVTAIAVCGIAEARVGTAASQDIAGGELAMLDDQGAIAGFCPLKTTAFDVEVSGQFANVRVRQVFE